MDKTDFHDIDRRIGQHLRQIRQFRGLSQHDLGRAIGVSYQQIQKYEKGRSRIPASRLYALACCLGVAPGAFFSPLTETAETARAQQAAILHAFAKLPPATRGRFLRLMQDLQADQPLPPAGA